MRVSATWTTRYGPASNTPHSSASRPTHPRSARDPCPDPYVHRRGRRRHGNGNHPAAVAVLFAAARSNPVHHWIPDLGLCPLSVGGCPPVRNPFGHIPTQNPPAIHPNPHSSPLPPP